MKRSSTTETCIQSATLSILLWLILLAFGGGLMAMYYAKIGYLPEVTWDDALTYLGVLSILGGGVVLAYSLLVFFPGLIWSEFMVSDRELRTTLCIRINDRYDPCYRSIMNRIGWPFLGVVLLAHFSVFLGGVHELLPFGVTFLLLVPASAFLVWRNFDKKLQQGNMNPEEKKSVLTKSVLYFTGSVIISLISLFFIYEIAKVRETEPNSRMLLICTIVVAASNLFVAAVYRRNRTTGIGISLLAAFTLLIAGELLASKPATAFSSRLMALYGFDSESQYSLILDKKGRDLIMSHGFPVEDIEGSRGARIEGVRILSRLGTDQILFFEGRRFSIPKSMVLSWADDASDISDMNARPGPDDT
jgi:hypothetical protein